MIPRQLRSLWFRLSCGAGAAGVFLLWPVLNLLAPAGPGEGPDQPAGRSCWPSPRYGRAIVNTIARLGVTVTAPSTLIGVPLAYFTARYDYPGKGLRDPAARYAGMPEVIAAQTWLMMLGNNGFLTRWLDPSA